METRSGEMVSAQIAKMGVIDKLDVSSFKLKGGHSFNIKNEGGAPVILQVKLAAMDEFISTSFAPGWNPEIVREVKQDVSLASVELKYGY